MANVVVYSKDYCPYCQRAKMLLQTLGQKFEEIDLIENPDRRDEMIAKAGGKSTVPQIFIDDKHIGGCDDLYDLHEQGGLEPLLAQ